MVRGIETRECLQYIEIPGRLVLQKSAWLLGCNRRSKLWKRTVIMGEQIILRAKCLMSRAMFPELEPRTPPRIKLRQTEWDNQCCVSRTCRRWRERLRSRRSVDVNPQITKVLLMHVSAHTTSPIVTDEDPRFHSLLDLETPFLHTYS